MSEGESLVNLSVYGELLDSKYLQILNFLLNYPGLTAFEVYKGVKHISINGKKPWPKTIWRYFNYLHKHNLIEVAKEYAPVGQNKIRDQIPFKISLNGIFYMMLNHVGQSYNELIIPLLHRYDSNVLFTLFLYPFINKNTLLKIEDNVVFSIIYAYLKNVCSAINNFVKSSNDLVCATDKDDGCLLKRLFMWPRYSNPLSTPESISFYDDDLRNHLKMTLKWDWIDKAKFIPNYDKNVVDIIKPNEPEEIIRLSINEQDGKAILMMNDSNLDEFIITTNTLFLSIDTKTKEKKSEYFLNLIMNKCEEYVPIFLHNLRSKVTPNLQSFELLSKDENFVKALEDMDKNIKIKGVRA